jgi:hypothetical protein
MMNINKLICLALLLLAFAVGVKAQGINTVIDGYLDVKNALVAGDGPLTTTKAKAFLKIITAVQPDAKQQSTWKKYANKLSSTTRQVSEAINLDQQREHFAGLSTNVYQLVKNLQPNSETIYVQYCPMKKASWLSSKKNIENPYYGEQMLTCGGIKETLAGSN